MVITEVINDQPEVIIKQLQDDGSFPNSKFPAIIYKNSLKIMENDAATVEDVFKSNAWFNGWRNGIYTYHHYHSTAHEVLGIYSGKVKVQLGGPEGITFEASTGDIIIIPAGVAHKNLGSSGNFGCVGAYPSGQTWDMNYGNKEERPQTDQNIAKVPLPETDPVYGKEGAVIKKWLS